MPAVTVEFDVNLFASEQFQRVSASNGHSSFKTQCLHFFVSLSPKKLVGILGSIVGSFLTKIVHRDISRIKQHILVFKGLREELRTQIHETGIYPHADLLAKIETAQTSLVKLRSTVKTVCFILRDANKESRLASMFDLLESEINDLISVVYRFRLVAIGADISERTWEEEVLSSRQNLHMEINSIDDLSEEGLDPEIYTLAISAVNHSK